MVRALSRLPRAFPRPAPVEAAAAGMERANEQRLREIVVASSAGSMLKVPRLAQRLAERFFTT